MSVTAHPSARHSLPGRPLEWRWLFIALATLAAVYLSMLNRYWVPSGDGEVYTCIARSLILDNKLFFNGAKAAIAPPGWPLVMSWLMRISPEFWFLKLAIIGSMLGGLASAFFIVRRFVSDKLAAGIIVLTGTLSSVYPLTYWTHTEAFFCLLSFTALLFAFRIAEGRARLWWEVPAMLFLLGFGAFTRWPGLLHAVLVIPILLSGAKRRPWRRKSAWSYVALVLLVCFGTFRSTYEYLRLSKEEQKLAYTQGAMSDADTDVDMGASPTTVPTTGPTATTGPTNADYVVPSTGDIMGSGKRTFVGEIVYRVTSSGRWFAWLLWQPTRFGQSVRLIDTSGLVFGWLAIVLLVITTVRAARRYDFFWIGLAAYTGGLCLLWPNPTARYFVPVAPFIVLGILRGIGEASAWVRERQASRGTMPAEPIAATPVAADAFEPLGYASRDSGRAAAAFDAHSRLLPGRPLPAFRALAIVFGVVTLLVNLPLLAIDIRVFRSHDFYGQYEAGANKELLEVAEYIRRHPQPGGGIVVHEFYDNMGRQRYSKFGVRALHLLLNQRIFAVDRRNRFLRMKPNDDELRKWLRKPEPNAVYCVTQESWTPWRVWHFRLSPSLQQWLTKRPVTTETGGWDVWGRAGARFQMIEDVPETFAPPTRVPGL